ncbi:hypothetical protein ACJX0J_016920, partial [Zea mays]
RSHLTWHTRKPIKIFHVTIDLLLFHLEFFYIFFFIFTIIKHHMGGPNGANEYGAVVRQGKNGRSKTNSVSYYKFHMGLLGS